MKILAATLLVVASVSAQAEIIATFPNKAGGHIMLMDDVFACPAGTQAYATSNFADQSVSDMGCWMLTGNVVFAQSNYGGPVKHWTGQWNFTDYGVARGWKK
jgi:hypothetical protein